MRLDEHSRSRRTNTRNDCHGGRPTNTRHHAHEKTRHVPASIDSSHRSVTLSCPL